jgi:hypothetical protein
VRFHLALLLLFLGMLVGSFVAGQSPNASLSGVVLDPDKRSIADAEILVMNDYTRVQYETKSNAEGFFAVTDLPPGQYRIQVSKVGFKAIIKPDIILNVQDALTLNFTLPLGAPSVVVTVEGGAPMINTTDATVSTVVDRQFAENLPMNGRSFQSLIYLTPGVVATTSTSNDGGQFSVNGQRAASNYWTVDGVSANVGVAANSNAGNGFGGTLGSFSALGGTNSLVSIDAMQEFRIQTSTFAPEFGRTPGAQISIVTRSGTNQFHGTLFDYLRNDVFDANNWFANSVGLPRPEERQNDFGGTVGGPIVKEKTFFFFSYEGLRLRLPQVLLTEVPDLEARLAAVPAMQPFLAAYPLPNGPDDPTTLIAERNASFSNPASLDAYSLRIDHRLTRDWLLFGRYNYSPSKFGERGGNGGFALSVVSTSRITTQTATAGLTGNLSPEITSDLRFNYSHVDANSLSSMDGFGGAVPLTQLPFPDPYTARNGEFDFFLFALNVGSALEEGRSSENLQRQINVVESLAIQKGSHSLKFGADYRRLSPTVSPQPYYQSAAFRTVAAATEGASFFSQVQSLAKVGFDFTNLGLFAQDSWRIRPRLTLTYGLRWDLDFAPHSDPAMPAVTGYSLSDLSNLAVAPLGTPVFQTRYGNVAPRIGVAYQARSSADWLTVLRGGFGVFYDLVSSESGNLIAEASLSPPLGDASRYFNTAFPLSAAQAVPPAIPAMATLSNITAYNPKLQLPYTLEWNVAVEQSLGKDQMISATYLGASGRRLLQTTEFSGSSTNPDVGTAVFVDNTAQSNYNALQIQFQRRLSAGLQTLASYTFSHSIDNASAGSFGQGSNLGGPSPESNRGNSDFDIRSAFSAGLTYAIPSPKQGWPKTFLGGWSVDNLVIARSAPPVDLTANFFGFNSGITTNVRPDIVPGQPFYLYGAKFPGGKALNPAAFTSPPVDPATGDTERQGTLGRNVLRAFGATQWDFAVHRDFPMRENIKLQFRAELFNVLNHPNFGPPNAGLGTPGFGLATQTLNNSLSGGSSGSSLGSGTFDPLYQLGGPRSVQLALKLFF